MSKKTGIDHIAEERAKHPSKGYDAKHDAEHMDGELIHAAKAYAVCAEYQERGHPSARRLGSFAWPWDEASFRPSDDPKRNLAKAGALLAAEIERLDNIDPTPINA